MLQLENLLRKVTKPARYTGGEWNSIVKDWQAVDVRVALAYPDLYEIGMSNLGLAILYDLLNKDAKVLAERVYAPWVDMEAAMRAASVPLFSLESRRPLKDFDIIGFSLSYELNYTNVLNMLDLAQIPVLASERTESHPLVIAGGSCALNPEPMADFIDLFLLGEGEELLPEFISAFRSWKLEGGERKEEFLRRAAYIEGIYVPTLYQVAYGSDSRVASISPIAAEGKSSIQRRIVSKLPPPVTAPVVPYIEVIHDRAAVEIQRGCTRGCRFCQASVIYRPVRERPQAEITDAIDQLLRNCGYNEASLVSLSTTDYSDIESLVSTLAERHKGDNLTLSLPSLRLDTFSVKLAEAIPGRKKTGLTFAPEAGSERLRHLINKSLSEEELLRAVETAFSRGWTSLKLYFMVGLPTETEDDVEGIVELVDKMRRLARKSSPKQVRLRVNASTFVPKAHTAFQWVAQATEEELRPKHDTLRLGLRKLGAHLSWHDPKTSLLEGVLARGDRRLAKVVYRAWQLGCRFDAWSEFFSFEKWLQAFADCSLDPSFYAHRERPLNEVLPWANIDSGVTYAFLRREYQRTVRGRDTPDCRHSICTTCGLERWNTDCKEKQNCLIASRRVAVKEKPLG